jgi:hypothetical protein
VSESAQRRDNMPAFDGSIGRRAGFDISPFQAHRPRQLRGREFSFRFKDTNVKRIAFLSLLLMPSIVGAQPSDPAPPPSTTVEGAAVAPLADGPLTQTSPRPLLSQPVEPRVAVGRSFINNSAAGWFGDLGFYVLRPQWGGGNPAFATTVTDNGTAVAEQTDFEHNYEFAPLVSIGYSGRNGLGGRVRWWTLQSSDTLAGAFDDVPPLDGAFVVPSLLGMTAMAKWFDGDQEAFIIGGGVRNRLDLDVIDMEGIWSTEVGRSSLLFSAGVRYAHISQIYDANYTTGPPAGGGRLDAENQLRTSNAFSGAGPTASLHAHRMIAQTNLSVYGLSRGSLLFGENRQHASNSFIPPRFPDQTPGDPGVEIEFDSSSRTSNGVRPVMELELGTNWTRRLGAFDLFAESGLVGMIWFNTGNAANTDTLLGGNVGADNANQDLGLIGLRFSTGVRF